VTGRTWEHVGGPIGLRDEVKQGKLEGSDMFMFWLIGAYLSAIVLANLSTAFFGIWSTPANAFVLVSFNLLGRDLLHDLWEKYGRLGLWVRMLCLIGIGGLISWLLNADAGRIAVASVTAFCAAELADFLVYTWLKDKGKKRVIRANGSNTVSAIVDSLTFITIAFGWPPVLLACAGQILAKVCGGAVWAWIFVRTGIWREDKAHEA